MAREGPSPTQTMRAFGVLRQDGIEGAYRNFEIFFRCQGADIGDDETIVGRAPLRTLRCAALGGVEQRGVDTAPEYSRTRHSGARQAVDEQARRRHGAQRATVKVLKPCADDGPDEACVVVLAVAVEMRVIA